MSSASFTTCVNSRGVVSNPNGLKPIGLTFHMNTKVDVGVLCVISIWKYASVRSV